MKGSQRVRIDVPVSREETLMVWNTPILSAKRPGRALPGAVAMLDHVHN